MTKPDITDFLLARIAEEEEEAQRGVDDVEDFPDGLLVTVWDLDIGIRYRPLKVLAECEAKRRLVGLHAPRLTERGSTEGVNYRSCEICDPYPPMDAPDPGPCETIRLLASLYANHPDYDESWRP